MVLLLDTGAQHLSLGYINCLNTFHGACCRYHEWYTRALKHGWTHIDIPDDNTMCEDVYKKVRRSRLGTL